ncbi:hypothetical protein QBC38DRAFT_499132 [Podospora fimiseda]|uniref:Uncharacterized protein n=1 Tax=Podospora fimiseda TaxID=252190 RepID=A0AAN7BQS1_9PEZI|nr:hypothetical protein QBC38DRAFT_499132 [Podospora fimiseda]
MVRLVRGFRWPWDTPANREEYPEGFMFTCCEGAGDADGCIVGKHQSKESMAKKQTGMMRALLKKQLEASVKQPHPQPKQVPTQPQPPKSANQQRQNQTGVKRRASEQPQAPSQPPPSRKRTRLARQTRLSASGIRHILLVATWTKNLGPFCLGHQLTLRSKLGTQYRDSRGL